MPRMACLSVSVLLPALVLLLLGQDVMATYRPELPESTASSRKLLGKDMPNNSGRVEDVNSNVGVAAVKARDPPFSELAVVQPAAAADVVDQSSNINTGYVAGQQKPKGNNQDKVPADHRASIQGLNSRKFSKIDNDNDRIPDEFIVLTTDDADVDSIVEQFVRGKGAQDKLKYNNAGAGVKGFSLKVPPGRANDILQALADHPQVTLIEENSLAYVSQTTWQPSPPSWGLDRIDQTSVGLNSWYGYTYNGAGVWVYVVDTGVRRTHSQFGGRVLAGWYNTGFGVNSALDDNGHGTHVAGTIAGSTMGVAKGANIVPVKVLSVNGSGTIDVIIAGINFAVYDTRQVNSKKVINLSLGGSISTALDTAVSNAFNCGVAVIAAAGNNNMDACNSSPGRAQGTFTVGSTARSDSRSSFSNYGGCLNIFAPGEGIASASHTCDTCYTILSGTSMATPHVAGVAARIIHRGQCAGNTGCVYDAMLAQATANVVVNAGNGSPNKLLFRSSAA